MQQALDPGNLLALAVPRRVLTATSRVSTAHASSLSAETDALGPDTGFRRNAFATSRRLARELLVEAGCQDAMIGHRADGAPIWPSGVCGSFSYKDEWCAVAVAMGPPGSALGIDVERLEDVPCEAWEDIVSPQELREMSHDAVLPPPQLVNLAFTAKEAYFKAQCPITGNAQLEFRDVELRVDWTDGQFSLMPLPPGLRAEARLRWNAYWCVAAVVLQPDRSEA